MLAPAMEEQQPVRRRRRRRRSSRAKRESIAWLTYILSLFRRGAHWGALLLILAVILVLGLGAPVITPLDKVLTWWHY